jgi:DNA-binding IclR family transcriptional regulator
MILKEGISLNGIQFRIMEPLMERSGTVLKAFKLLDAMYRAGGHVSLADLAKAMGMPKPTVHRLLASLSQFDLVERTEAGGYALGIGLMRLGLSAQKVDPLVRLARPWLEQAAHEFGETFFAVGARAGRLFVLDKVEGSGILRATPNVGEEVAIENTASGRLYLGLAPDRVRAGLTGKPIDSEAVDRAVKRGYDTNVGEWLTGVTVVAAPVRIHQELMGCIACAGASAAMTGHRLREAIARTRTAAMETEHRWDNTNRG